MNERSRFERKPASPSPWKSKPSRSASEAGKPEPTESASSAEPRQARPSGEIRLYGRNACIAAFARRPQDLRKVYLIEARLQELKPVLAWCARNKLGYRMVENADLDKLTGSRHHEGVCFEMLRPQPHSLADLLAAQPPVPQASLLVWLDGVGNPHNLGALLRSAAHFSVAGVIVPASSSLDLSGAAVRVAEGGAEAVTLVRVDDDIDALAQLRAAGYAIAATVPRDGNSLYSTRLAARSVLVFGAEGEGMSKTLIDAADVRLTIPGSGVIESLNIAASAAIVLGSTGVKAVATAIDADQGIAVGSLDASEEFSDCSAGVGSRRGKRSDNARATSLRRPGSPARQWESTSGRPHTVDFKLIANGTVLVETWTMSPTRISMTVYALDGTRLLATHFCPQGTQPRLRLAEKDAHGRYQFRFLDGTTCRIRPARISMRSGSRSIRLIPFGAAKPMSRTQRSESRSRTKGKRWPIDALP